MAKGYFAIGATEGLVSAIAIKFGTDISATGIVTAMLNALKPTIQTVPSAMLVYYIAIIAFAICPWIALYLTAKEEPIPTIAGFLLFFLIVLFA
ncbi:Uncharacterised protein [uncultured archaeon]|nr:Uncharacterised protein [uncultured archaeon]